ncbi:hypothetical protein PCE1_000856 [Barthelona sp. PCE]
MFEVYSNKRLIIVARFCEEEGKYQIFKVIKKSIKDYDPNLGMKDLLFQNDMVYDREQFDRLLSQARRLKLIGTFSVLLGLIRFSQGYYLMFAQQKMLGLVCENEYYSLNDFTFIQCFSDSTTSDEAKYKNLCLYALQTQNFYYSNYDLTSNVLDQYQFPERVYTDLFCWNHIQIVNALQVLDMNWITPMINGSVEHRRFFLYGKYCELILISRRTREYAGTRYLKRGINSRGYVANEVETEQIVYCPNDKLVSSYVQIRGSIPLFWGHRETKINPKPPAIVRLQDWPLTSMRLHFSQLLHRYGEPLLLLDLVKSKKHTGSIGGVGEPKISSEGLLGGLYALGVSNINMWIEEEHKIQMMRFDYSTAKHAGVDCRRVTTEISEMAIKKTGFTIVNIETSKIVEKQKGILRTNCIDCLDRTMAAQLASAVVVLKRQFEVIGVPWFKDTALTQIIGHMYVDNGDHIALQYGGSLVHDKEGAGQTKRSKLLTSITRFYSNTFTDQPKQDGINIILGKFKPWEHGDNVLWNFDNDLMLHNDPVYQLPFLDMSDNSWLYQPILKSMPHYQSVVPDSFIVLKQEITKKKSDKVLKKKYVDFSDMDPLVSSLFIMNPPQADSDDEEMETEEESIMKSKISELELVITDSKYVEKSVIQESQSYHDEYFKYVTKLNNVISETNESKLEKLENFQHYLQIDYEDLCNNGMMFKNQQPIAKKSKMNDFHQEILYVQSRYLKRKKNK